MVEIEWSRTCHVISDYAALTKSGSYAAKMKLGLGLGLGLGLAPSILYRRTQDTALPGPYRRHECMGYAGFERARALATFSLFLVLHDLSPAL